ncbi:MAG: hypothetical protein ACRESZ_08690 [Methylococcales bacterium]
MPSPHADLTLYDRDGRLVAIAEVKNKHGTSSDWAAKFRRNLLVHGGYFQADFFLLVSPDRLYIWKNASIKPILIQPTYEIDARPFFAPYFERARVNPENSSGQAFELVVAAWLADLMRSEEQEEIVPEGPSVLAESGFLAAVRQGRIAFEEAA